MTGNISKALIATLVTTFLTGCAKEPPKCSDEETYSLVRSIILDQIGGSEGLTEKEIQDNLKIEFARASAFDENIKKYSCEAKLISGGGFYEVPITYETQLDDNGQHIVTVGGIAMGDLIGVKSGLVQGIQKARATSQPAENSADAQQPTETSTDTHCDAKEQVVFSCNTGEKIVSVCASQSLTPSNGSMQYRFGPKGAPDLSFPEPGAHPNTFGAAGTLTFSGGGGAYLRLMNGGFGYVVYTATGQDGVKSGFVVEKNGEVLVDRKCQNPAQSILGPDFFEKAGLPEDDQGFDLP
jgi:hypothetical protein